MLQLQLTHCHGMSDIVEVLVLCLHAVISMFWLKIIFPSVMLIGIHMSRQVALECVFFFPDAISAPIHVRCRCIGHGSWVAQRGHNGYHCMGYAADLRCYHKVWCTLHEVAEVDCMSQRQFRISHARGNTWRAESCLGLRVCSLLPEQHLGHSWDHRNIFFPLATNWLNEAIRRIF